MGKKSNIVALISMLLILNACSGNVYLSQGGTGDFRMDGYRNEWIGRFQIPDGEKFALGLSNDKNYLYVAISSIDEGFQRQITKDGLTLWLDAKGGKRQILGIKYEGLNPQMRRPRTYQNQPDKSQGTRETGFGRENMFENDLTLIVIDTKAGRSLGPADLIATGNSIDETLFLEYQIPLTLLGDGFNTQKKLGLGIRSSLESPSQGVGRASGMSDGGRGGRAGRSEGGRGGQKAGGGARSGGPSGANRDQHELDVWIRVQLTD